eukprot:1159698-Pelagomonas_calceolata.AAC.2
MPSFTSDALCFKDLAWSSVLAGLQGPAPLPPLPPPRSAHWAHARHCCCHSCRAGGSWTSGRSGWPQTSSVRGGAPRDCWGQGGVGERAEQAGPETVTAAVAAAGSGAAAGLGVETEQAAAPLMRGEVGGTAQAGREVVTAAGSAVGCPKLCAGRGAARGSLLFPARCCFRLQVNLIDESALRQRHLPSPLLKPGCAAPPAAVPAVSALLAQLPPACHIHNRAREAARCVHQDYPSFPGLSGKSRLLCVSRALHQNWVLCVLKLPATSNPTSVPATKISGLPCCDAAIYCSHPGKVTLIPPRSGSEDGDTFKGHHRQGAPHLTLLLIRARAHPLFPPLLTCNIQSWESP